MLEYPLNQLRSIATAMAEAAMALTISAPAEAMRMSPMVAEISLSGGASSARIDVGNETSTPLPY